MKNPLPGEHTIGHVFQISLLSENLGAELGGQLITATEIHHWGVTGYYTEVFGYGSFRERSRILVRANWDEIEFVGVATWVTMPLILEEEVSDEPKGA